MTTKSSGWNYADVWESIADCHPHVLAAAHGDLERSWRDFDERADGVAAALLDAGLSKQATVAQYMRNGPAYLESMFGAFKAGHVPVNTNYRYTDDELRYLWGDCEAAAVVFDAEFTDVCDRLRPQLPAVRVWLRIGGSGDDPDWSLPYESAAEARPGRVRAPSGRSGDDLYLLYTGGTTGMPKGVMWRQDDLFRMLEARRAPAPEIADAAAWVEHLDRLDPAVIPAPPLMHGAACMFSLPVLSRGGTIVTLTGRSLDAVELLDAVVARGVRRLCIVGDAFAKPIIGALEAEPERWDLSGLRVIFSTGAFLSEDSKHRLLTFAVGARIIDGLGSSESGSLGTSVTSSDTKSSTAKFVLSPDTRVIDDENSDVVAGSGAVGRLAVGGYLPLGYYRDPVKTATTFVTVDGRRYVVAGDLATVDVDGTITLLGRGSSCINTAGEKVYPEEVEQAIKDFGPVRDAAVVGVPDERYGQSVVALLESEATHALDTAALLAFLKQHLAAYKVPRHVFVLESLERGPNGKLDHKQLGAIANDLLSAGVGDTPTVEPKP